MEQQCSGAAEEGTAGPRSHTGQVEVGLSHSLELNGTNIAHVFVCLCHCFHRV